MSRYYSKTEQREEERQVIFRIGLAVVLFAVAVGMLVGGSYLAVVEATQGNSEASIWAGILTAFFVAVLGYFIKDAINPASEENPDIAIRHS